MKNTDRFTILKKSTELLDKMDIGTADQRSKGLSLEVSLETMYVKAKMELISHIKKQVAPIKRIEDLTQCLVDTCYGFAALGMRQDLVYKKLLGASKTRQEALINALKKDINEDNPHTWFEPNIEPREVSTFVQEAFDSNGYSLYPENTDDKALAFIYFLDRLQEYSCKIDLTPVALDFQYFSCLKVILNDNWGNRSLAGYFDDCTYYKVVTDNDFVNIFGNKLRELLAQADTKRAEHFKSLQIKQYIQEQIIQAYAGNNSARPLVVYAEIEKLIAISDKGIITQDDYEDATYSGKFAVAKRFDSNGVRYELSTDGLMALAGMLESLGLNGLQEVNVFIDKIKTACA